MAAIATSSYWRQARPHQHLMFTSDLLNNTLATYNMASTARMLNLADQLGMPADTLLDAIGVYTGQSWMGDNIIDVQCGLLLKDVALLRNEVDSLPVGLDDVEAGVLHTRTLREKGRPKI
ncbi:hypothetical protein HQO82_12600 [Rhodococcus fascians]|nr:hypothetical protein [Rhodococcus fascians]MBY4114662.1 hypothetical protein [Rhodococcus fascians]